MHPVFYQFALGLWGILPGNYSAITPVENHVYAIVDDKDDVDGYQLLTLDFYPRSGRLKHAELAEPRGMAARRRLGEGTPRDCEGICYHPERRTLFVSGEADQQIVEYDLNGYPTGQQLHIPAGMSIDSILPNRGLEALTYDTSTHLFWTTTEYALPADTFLCTRLVAFGDDLQPSATLLYPLDGAEFAGEDGNDVYGVASVLAIGDGRLLVLEREVFMPHRQKSKTSVTIRLYIVNPHEYMPADNSSSIPPVAAKRLLYSFTTRVTSAVRSLANYEGMCWGPVLPDGRRTLLLIADSQKGYGNKLYHLKDYLGVLVFREEI